MTPTAIVEIEREFIVDEGTPLPPLQALLASHRVGEPVELDLEAVYFDTAGLDLASRRISLCRRAGDADPGWQLTLPVTSNGHRELTEPLGADSTDVPEALAQEVRAVVRDRALGPVARLLTRRTMRSLLGGGDEVLAVFCDDLVHGDRLVGEAAGLEWREWKIELVTGDVTLLPEATALLTKAGARPSEYLSALSHVLGDRFPAPWPVGPAATHRDASTSDVLLGYVLEQVRMLGAQDPLVRRDEPDAVHQMRVACRRLRSVLATYRTVLDAQAVNQIRADLQWLAGAMGTARDTQVIHERLMERLNAEPSELIIGPIAERIAEQLEADFHAARLAGLAVLDTARYFRLLDTLDAFLVAPPVNKRGRKPARRLVRRLIRTERNELRTLVRTAKAAPRGSRDRDLALHEVRKRAKRLRYAAETAIPVRRKAARQLVDAAQGMQTILGDYQDSVVARDVLLRLATSAQERGESGFSYGRLHALEQSSAAVSEAMFWLAWTTFTKPKLDSQARPGTAGGT